MSVVEIKEILKGDFADVSDREYWEKKLQAEQIKEKAAIQNKAYFQKMKKYDR